MLKLAFIGALFWLYDNRVASLERHTDFFRKYWRGGSYVWVRLRVNFKSSEHFRAFLTLPHVLNVK